MKQMFNTLPLAHNHGPQKTIGSIPCPSGSFQILWLLASPLLAHGIGESEGKTIKSGYLSAAVSNQVLWFQTNPFTGLLLHAHLLSEKLILVIGHLIPHDIIRSPG